MVVHTTSSLTGGFERDSSCLVIWVEGFLKHMCTRATSTHTSAEKAHHPTWHGRHVSFSHAVAQSSQARFSTTKSALQSLC